MKRNSKNRRPVILQNSVEHNRVSGMRCSTFNPGCLKTVFHSDSGYASEWCSGVIDAIKACIQQLGDAKRWFKLTMGDEQKNGSTHSLPMDEQSSKDGIRVSCRFAVFAFSNIAAGDTVPWTPP